MAPWSERERMPEQRTLLLGRDHIEYGVYECVELTGGRLAAAMSAGADPASPSMRTKGNVDVPNEDALLVVEQEDRVLFVVADAHYGWQASHEFVIAIEDAIDEIPVQPGELERIVSHLQLPASHPGSASTLLVAVYDRETRMGSGLSFGDSSLVLVGPEGARTANVLGSQFVDPVDRGSFQPDQGYEFRFFAQPGQLILAFSDGVNECHYRSPRTSVAHRHLAALFDEVGPRPEGYARRLMELALGGVDGNPGGQDNIALVVGVA